MEFKRKTEGKLVILRGLKQGNRFWSTNSPEYDHTKLLDGTVAYEILDYADSVEEVQMKLYGCAHTLPTLEAIVNIVQKEINTEIEGSDENTEKDLDAYDNIVEVLREAKLIK